MDSQGIGPDAEGMMCVHVQVGGFESQSDTWWEFFMEKEVLLRAKP